MYHISKVVIHKIWDTTKMETSFYNDVNMFIGNNGTGKTTFINLIQATILVDIEVLSDIDFEKIEILLKSESKQKTIKVIKEFSLHEDFDLRYKISNDTYKIEDICSLTDRMKRRRMSSFTSRRLESQVFVIREEIQKFINLSWIAVDRRIFNQAESYSVRKSSYDYDETLHTTIDNKIAYLMKAFFNYHNQLEVESSKISLTFQRKMLINLLYDEKFDNPDSLKKIQTDYKEIT